MQQAVKALKEQVLQLPPLERIALVEHILDSLDEPDSSIDALWAREADDRLTAYRRGEIHAVTMRDIPQN